VQRHEIHRHVNDYKDDIWDMLTKKIPQWKKHSFHHMVRTDGYGCSLCYSYQKAGDNDVPDKKQKQKKKNQKKEAQPEFPRLDMMSKEECDTILAGNPFAILAADPGVNNPATICDATGRILKYTNKRRQDENCNTPHKRWLLAEKKHWPPPAQIAHPQADPLPRDKRTRLRLHKKQKLRRKKRHYMEHGKPPAAPTAPTALTAPTAPPPPQADPKPPVIAAEEQLSRTNRRALSTADYKKFLDKRKEVDPVLRPFYARSKMKHEKLRYRRFCKQAWSDAKLVKEIKERFLTPEQHQQLEAIPDEKERRDKVIIVFGNWSRSTQMKGTHPSPAKGLRHMLDKHFHILTIWEGHTSQLYHATHQQLEPVYVRRIPDSAPQKIHEVLTCQRDPTHRTFVNRDVNASRNIHHLALSWLHEQTRPKCFGKL
jgi:hypothetical protein